MVGLAFGFDVSVYGEDFHGPPSFLHWDTCYKVLQAALIMLNAVDPPHLINYHDMIQEYSNTFGEDCWALLYQSKFRF